MVAGKFTISVYVLHTSAQSKKCLKVCVCLNHYGKTKCCWWGYNKNSAILIDSDTLVYVHIPVNTKT